MCDLVLNVEETVAAADEVTQEIRDRFREQIDIMVHRLTECIEDVLNDGKVVDLRAIVNAMLESAGSITGSVLHSNSIGQEETINVIQALFSVFANTTLSVMGELGSETTEGAVDE